VRAASATSEHPLATQALGECVGALLEHGGTHPDVVWLFTTPPHVGVLEDIEAALRRLLSPGVLLGAVADTVVGGGREIEGQPAMSLLAVWSSGPPSSDGGGPVRSAPVALRLRSWRQGPDPADLEQLRGASGTLSLLVDRPSLAPELLLEALAEVAPELRVVGAALDPPSGRHANVLVHADAAHGDGAVGVLLPPGPTARVVLSQGVRTIGTPMAVTRAERNVVLELGGRPADHHLDVALATLAQGGDPAPELLLAEVLEPGAEGDDELLVHRLVGRDPDRGGLALDAEVDVGSLVVFAGRDAASADADLTLRLAEEADGAAAALCVLGTGRGWPLFGTPDHDALAVSELLPGAALAGLVAPAPFATVGRRHQIAPRSVAILLAG
jgi:small ligand-binding sensory domain FIST